MKMSCIRDPAQDRESDGISVIVRQHYSTLMRCGWRTDGEIRWPKCPYALLSHMWRHRPEAALYFHSAILPFLAPLFLPLAVGLFTLRIPPERSTIPAVSSSRTIGSLHASFLCT